MKCEREEISLPPFTFHYQPAAMETVFIGFGSNVGDRVDYCDRAVTLLSLLPHSRLQGVSLLYETEPVRDRTDPGAGWFLNGVVQLETDIAPHSLVAMLQEIERALGRDDDQRSGPRTMDLDILFYDDVVFVEGKTLSIPHPKLSERTFVLKPLSEIAADLVHPRLGKSVREMLEALLEPTA